MLLSLRLDGSTACLLIAGAIDGLAFREYIRQVLVPNLKAGDIVILDNLSVYKDKRALKLIKEAGANAKFLPLYSPDLNPIEKMWSKVKSILREIKARTQEALDQAIAKALDAVTPEDAKAWFKSCGYEFN